MTAIRDPHQLLVFARGDDDFGGIAISISLYFISYVCMIVVDNADVDTALSGPAAECAGPDRERSGACAAEEQDEFSSFHEARMSLTCRIRDLRVARVSVEE